jgi:hypothetical protein
MKIDIKSRWTAEVLFSAEIETTSTSASVHLGLAVRKAVESGAYLSRANLSGADLSRADLNGANLSGANLNGADLNGANLNGADLSRADLNGANLNGAYLSGADLSGADLSGADLNGANLSGADLSRADLSRADLSGADLPDTPAARLAIARTRIIPAEGTIIGWKKCRGGVLVKLRVPEDAKRSHAFGRKCRAEYVEVIEVVGAEAGISQHDGKTTYRTGETVRCDVWNEDWREECGGGIHFFITREEAEDY